MRDEAADSRGGYQEGTVRLRERRIQDESRAKSVRI